MVVSDEYWRRMKKESVWVKSQGEELLSALLLPPLQVVAAGLNFCTLCVINHHLFRLPFESLEAIKYSEDLINNLKHKSDSLEANRPAPASDPDAERRRVEATAYDPESLIESVTKDTAEEGAATDRQPSF
jgi:hypothetical protein